MKKSRQGMIVGGILLGVLGGIGVRSLHQLHVDRMKTSATAIELDMLATAVQMYRNDIGKWPSAETPYEDLATDTRGGGWKGPYVSRPWYDKWHCLVVFSNNEDTCEIRSAGPDRLLGNADDVVKTLVSRMVHKVVRPPKPDPD